MYPQENGFDVMMIISYKLCPEVDIILPMLSKKTAELFEKADDYMKLGKWIMLHIDNEETMEDYIKLVNVKLPPKVK